MSKTLVAHVTRWGATTETAKTISDILKEEFSIETDFIDLKSVKKQRVDLDPYKNIIFGVSVAMFRWAKEGKNFLKQNDFTGKNMFAFVSSGRCGVARREGNQQEYEKWQKKYIDDVLAKYSVHYTSRKAFGGVYRQQGKPTDDSRNWDDIKGWAREVGEYISSQN